MARPAIGQVLERHGKRGTTYALRFTKPDGERRQVRLGSAAEGWTRRRAEDELQAVLADLRRGQPNALAAPPVERPDPLFAAFAHEWFERVRHELRPTTVAAYDAEVRHLLPWFGRMPLSAITPQEVDRFRQSKVRERTLSATYINSILTRLAQILELAVEYGLVERNAARGRNRRLRQTKYRGTSLDGADAIAALLDAAGELDSDRARRSDPFRRALLAVLVFAGLRIDEALSLRWRDVNLPSRTLRVGRAKTDAGYREVDLLPALADELAGMRASAHGLAPDALVFATGTGGKRTPSNVRNRLLAAAVEKANATLDDAGRPPLPEPLTPHSLRRTFISVLLTLGEPVPYVMEQAGHTDPKVTLGIYARVMRRSADEKRRLRQLVDGGDLVEVPRVARELPLELEPRVDAVQLPHE